MRKLTYQVHLQGKNVSINHQDPKSAETTLKFFKSYYGKMANLTIIETRVSPKAEGKEARC